jgi:hypothetical protein
MESLAQGRITEKAKSPPAALQALLARIIDYAGLFPPAGSSMSDAVANYAQYQASESAWALGRFVVPANRLAEFEAARSRLPIRQTWQLTCLIGDNLHDDSLRVHDFNRRSRSIGAAVDSIEIKLGCGDRAQLLRQIPPSDVCVYFEVSLDEPLEQLAAINKAGARAKLRTGGVTAEAIPSAEGVTGFLSRCADAGVAFKATAGLHHPVRSIHPLTYEPNAPRARMHGFLNVFLAAAFALQKVPQNEMAAVLNSENPADFYFDDIGARWRDSTLTTDQIRHTRDQFAISFGSCSFEEPLHDLRDVQIL